MAPNIFLYKGATKDHIGHSISNPPHRTLCDTSASSVSSNISKMANTGVLVLCILSLTIASVLCQTFQYSHGWTNGKRSTSSMLEELVNSPSRNAGQLDNVLANCELQKLRLLLQGNVNNQLLQVPCELVGSFKRSLPENIAPDHFHRQSTATNNNY